jgi:hypothetical protein
MILMSEDTTIKRGKIQIKTGVSKERYSSNFEPSHKPTPIETKNCVAKPIYRINDELDPPFWCLDVLSADITVIFTQAFLQDQE